MKITLLHSLNEGDTVSYGGEELLIVNISFNRWGADVSLGYEMGSIGSKVFLANTDGLQVIKKENNQ